MKVLEEYAIESSISKVYGSEVVDYCVDEAVQIFGGYGFHEDYPVARAVSRQPREPHFRRHERNQSHAHHSDADEARDGRRDAVDSCGDEIGGRNSGRAVVGRRTDRAAGARGAVWWRMAKKIFLLAAGAAVQKFREQLAEQQEIVAALANIVMEIYAMESCLRRAQKTAWQIEARPRRVMADAARAFISDAVDRIEHEARTALAATVEGDKLRTQIAVLRRFAKRDAVDTIALRRRVAAAVLAGDRYPFEGR